MSFINQKLYADRVNAHLVVLSEVLILHVLPSESNRADTSESPMHSVLLQKMLHYTRGDDKTNIICTGT